MYSQIELPVPTVPALGDTITIGGRNANGTTITPVTLTAVASAPGANQFVADGNLTNTLNNVANAFNAVMAGKASMSAFTGPPRLVIDPDSTARATTTFFMGFLSGTGNLGGTVAYTNLAGTFSLVNPSQTITGTVNADTIDVFNGGDLSSANIDGDSETDIIYVIGNETVTLGAGTTLTNVEQIIFNANSTSKILDIVSIADLDSLTTLNLGGGTIRLQSAGSGMVDFSTKTLVDVGEIARLTTNAGAIKASAGFTGKISGSTAAESLLGSSGFETIFGNDGGDSIDGVGGADTLYGESGDDTIRGGVNHDRVDGGADNDLILVSGSEHTGFDSIFGGLGIDTIEFDNALFDLGGSTVTEIEHIKGTFASGNRVNLEATNHFPGVMHYTGGAGIDTIGVFSGHADFTGKTLNSIEVLELMTGNNLLTMPAGVSVMGRIGVGNGTIVAALADVAAGTQTFQFQNVASNILRLTGGGTIDFTSNGSFTGLGTVELSGATAYAATAHGTVAARYVGGTGADSLFGGAVADTLQGGDGNDTLVASAGADKFQGGNNDDVILFPSGTINTGETIDGGAGALNILRFEGASALLVNNATISNIQRIETATTNATLAISDTQLTGVTKIHMQGGGTAETLSVSGTTVDLSAITLTGINKITPGVSPSTITLPGGVTLLASGSNNAETFVAPLADIASNAIGFNLLLGTDRVVMTGGGTIDLGSLTTFSGVDEVLFKGAVDYIVQGTSSASHLYMSESGNDSITGGTLADTMFGGTGGDTLVGADGDDVLVGELGAGSLSGGFGNDRLFGSVDADALDGGTDNDILVAGDQNDRLWGVDGADTLFGEAGADTLEGGSDGDILAGGADADSLLGGVGADTLFGGTENDTIDGGGDTAVDFLLGGDGSDLLIAVGGDVMWGGTGTDTFRLTAAGTFTIADFATGDKIDLTVLNSAYTGSAAVTLVGTPVIGSNGVTYTFQHGGNTIVLQIAGTPAPTGLVAGDFV